MVDNLEFGNIQLQINSPVKILTYFRVKNCRALTALEQEIASFSTGYDGTAGLNQISVMYNQNHKT